MKCVWVCFQLVMILAVCYASSEEEKGKVSGIHVRVPKCQINGTINDGTCSKTNEMVNYDHFYIDSNKTHIERNRKKFTPTFYYRSLICPEGSASFIEKFDDILGITSNASLISHQNGDPVFPLIHPEEYCATECDQRIAFLVCVSQGNYQNVETAELIFLYCPFLILSTLCYFCSAFIYWFILKVKQIHKKCFIGYALSMGVSFSFLITFQTMNGDTGCNVIGGLFFISILSAFSWLTCQCFENIIMVRRFKEEPNDERFRFYLAVTLIHPILSLLISLVPTGKPDIPRLFIKSNGNQMCNFEDGNVLFLFIEIGALLTCCLLFLLYNFHQVQQNEKKYRNHFNWLEKRSQFMYISRSCFLIWLTSTIWIVDIVIRELYKTLGNADVYDVIESLQGIFAVAIFVMNRYTRKEIWAKLTSDSSTTIVRRKRIGTLNWLMSKLSSKKKSSPENQEEERVNVV